jgi:NADH-quinone oxidoreductase subunit H
MRAWRWVLLPLLAAGAILSLAMSPWSRSDRSSASIRVSSVAPRDVELGDRIAISGEGFPSGKPARVTFRGALRRAGDPSQDDAEVVLPGVVLGPDRVEIAFDDAARTLFCGAEDVAAHATFTGDVEVAFAPPSVGSPPMAGLFHGVTLDAHPGANHAETERSERGRFAMDFFGLRAGPQVGAVGLKIEQVNRGSKAEAFGLHPGDVIAMFDGLHVTTLGDMTPTEGKETISMSVLRPPAMSEIVWTVSMDGFERASAVAALVPAGPLLFTVALVLLYAVPLPLSIGAWLRRMVIDVRARRETDEPKSRVCAGIGVRSYRPTEPDSWAHDVARTLLHAIAWAGVGVFPFLQVGLGRKVDVGMLFIAAASAAVLAALAAAKSGLRGLAAAAHVTWQHVPAGAGVAVVVVTTGCLRASEIARLQGVWPWQWLAFQSPATWVGCLLFLSALFIDPLPRNAKPSLAGFLGTPAVTMQSIGRAATWLEAIRTIHRFAVSAMAVTLFLGAWWMPWIDLTDFRTGPALVAGGWFLAKTLALMALAGEVRNLIPELPVPRTSRLITVWLVPLGALALGLAIAWVHWRAMLEAEAARTTSSILFAISALLALVCGHHIHYGLSSAPGGDRMDPFA